MLNKIKCNIRSHFLSDFFSKDSSVESYTNRLDQEQDTLSGFENKVEEFEHLNKDNDKLIEQF